MKKEDISDQIKIKNKIAKRTLSDQMTNLAYIIHIEPFKCPPSGCKTSKKNQMCLNSCAKQSPLLAAFKTVSPLSFSPALLPSACFLLNSASLTTAFKPFIVIYAIFLIYFLQFRGVLALKIREKLSSHQPVLTKLEREEISNTSHQIRIKNKIARPCFLTIQLI